MKAIKRKLKRGTALVLALAMSFGQFPLLPDKAVNIQAQESTGNKPSVTAFATKDELMNVFEADGMNTTVGKIIFG